MRETRAGSSLGPLPSTRRRYSSQLVLPRLSFQVALGDVVLLTVVYSALSAYFDLQNGQATGLGFSIGRCLALAGVYMIFALEHGATNPVLLVHPLQSLYVILKTTVLSGAVFHLLPLVGGPVQSRVTSFGVVAILALTMALWRLLLSRVVPAAVPSLSLIVVGAGWSARTLADAVASNPNSGMHITAFVDDDPTVVGSKYRGIPIFPVRELPALARSATDRVRLVWATTDQATAQVFDQVSALVEEGFDAQPMAATYEEATGRVPIHHLGHYWWAVLPKPPANALHLVAKRMIDVSVALMGLAALCLLLPILAPLLRRETGGSTFFVQTRIGRYGRPIKIAKLRTLPVATETYTNHWDRKAANRAARVGTLLRKMGVDELPQLLNVLKGEMSLVGPRPYVPEEVSDLQKQIPFFRTRALIKPGLTGWAQVNWGYGLSLADELEKFQLDLYYLAHQSLYLDLLIIARTLKLVIRRNRPQVAV